MFKFLNLKPEIFAVDINDLSLRIVKLKKKRNKFVLVSFNEVSIAPGIVKEGVIQNEEALARMLDNACKTVKGKSLDTKYAVVSLPEEKSFSQVIEMPQMTDEELRLAVPFEAENYIPLPIEKVYLDFQTIDYHEKGTNHLDLLINVMPKPIIDSYVSCFKRIGLVPCILEVESQAVVRACAKSGEKIPPTIFVDFGGTKTSLSIYSGNSIRFTVTISISSSQLTDSISKKMGIGFNEAERLKVQYGISQGTSKKSMDLLPAMSPVLKKLSEEIKKYMDFYRGHSSHEYFPSEGNIKRIVLCGGGASLKGLAEFLSKELNTSVEQGNPLSNVVLSRASSFPLKGALSFTTAIGSALRGANDTYLNSYSDNA